MDFQISIDKFHRILLKKYKIRKLNPKEQTIRNLLCYYQTISCKKFPNEADFTVYLQNAYDLQFKVNLSSIGTYSVLTYSLSCVDPKYIKDDTYTYSLLEEIFETCIDAYIINDNFDLKTFKKAKEIYASNLLYLKEDESRNAMSEAIQFYFKNTSRAFSPEGDLETLSKITCKKLFKYYQSIQKDEDISFVVGNVEKKFKMNNTSTLKIKKDKFFYKRSICPSLYVKEADTKQVYLEIIYNTNIFPSRPNLFYAISFINYMFGGSASSKLFTIIREKYGLCYSISSTHFGASGIILLSAIIEKANVDIVIEKIDNILATILNSFPIDEIKKDFILEIKGREDYLSNYAYDALLENYFVDYISPRKEIEIINNLTIEDLKTAYQRINKSLVYIYGGTSNEE